MKNILLATALTVTFQVAAAQETFKTAFNNHAENTVELSISIDEIEIVGSPANEIVIESLGEKNPRYGQKKPPSANTPLPDRAKGLKPVSPAGNDNTGLGLTVEKLDGHIRIVSESFLISNKFRITLPNKVKLIIHDMQPHAGEKSDYHISNMENEITASSLNSNIRLTNITGPAVLNVVNGNVEAVYSSITTTNPISIVTVNGFVDLSIPGATKADLQLQTMNGRAYTDFEVKSDADNEAISFPSMQIFHLDGKINGGGAIKININSVNGDIYLRKN